MMSWFQHDTSRIYYEEHGKGDPVLLLPGFSQGGEDLAALRDTIAASYRVIVADLPGSGRSEPQPRAYTATYYEEDARAFAALLQNLGAAPAHLIGFSDGGEVALLMAALTPTIARSLVTWGAAGVMSDPEGQLRQAMYNVIDHPIPPLQQYSAFLKAKYGEDNARAMTQNLVGAISAIIENGGDISLSKAGAITCPALLISGEHDVFAPPALAAQTGARIRAANTVTVEGAGHDVQNSHPDWLARTILDWLKSH